MAHQEAAGPRKKTTGKNNRMGMGQAEKHCPREEPKMRSRVKDRTLEVEG